MYLSSFAMSFSGLYPNPPATTCPPGDNVFLNLTMWSTAGVALANAVATVPCTAYPGMPKTWVTWELNYHLLPGTEYVFTVYMDEPSAFTYYITGSVYADGDGTYENGVGYWGDITTPADDLSNWSEWEPHYGWDYHFQMTGATPCD